MCCCCIINRSKISNGAWSLASLRSLTLATQQSQKWQVPHHQITHPIVSSLWLSDSTGHLRWLTLYRSTWSHHVLRFYHFHRVSWTFQLYSSCTNTPSPPDRVAHSASGLCTVGPEVGKHSRQTSSLYLCSHVVYWVTEKKHINPIMCTPPIKTPSRHLR